MSSSRRSRAICIRGARTHNLKNISVEFPAGKLSVVTGVSGSGKSSLVMDVLETEARRRYLESLSMYERQGVREGAEAQVDSVSGLGVTVTITPERRLFNRRATVGAATEISHHLYALLAALGQRTCVCGAEMHRGMLQWECPQCGEHAAFARPRQFSAATYGAACRECHGIGSLQVPVPEKLIIHPEKPLCDGAMYSPGFFPRGYLGKPYNGGYDMLQALARRYGFDPHTTPWQDMSPAARQAFLFGDPQPMQVIYENRRGQQTERTQPFPGFYGFIRDWDVGGTYTRTDNCPQCSGAGLRPEYLAVRLGGGSGGDTGAGRHDDTETRGHGDTETQGHSDTGEDPSLAQQTDLLSQTELEGKVAYNVYELHQLTLSELHSHICRLSTSLSPDHTAFHSIQVILKRVEFLQQVGLGYLHLGRIAGTLSAGEAQRIRLAGLLGSGLTSLTVLLDEPSRGLHPREIEALMQALRSLQAEGNTVIVVEHEPAIIQSADYLVEMGPGAGAAGGQITACGPAAAVLSDDTLTARWLKSGSVPLEADRLSAFYDLFTRPRREPHGWMEVLGARANNLKGDPLRLPLGVLAGVCGVSGSGKSTLVIDTLGRALAPRKQTTSVAYEPVEPGWHEAIRHAPGRAVLVDQTRAGIVSPASYLGLEALLRGLYAGSAEAHALGLRQADFSRRCQVCGGRGFERTDMGFLPAVYSPCETCRGTGYPSEAWQVRLFTAAQASPNLRTGSDPGLSLPELGMLTLDELFNLLQKQSFLDDEMQIRPVLQSALDVGLGYLSLYQPGRALSGGEVQRLKIAAELARPGRRDTLYILDEPTVGQHLADVHRLAGVLHRLVDEGASVLVVEHHPHLLSACDWLVEMGPAGGPAGGYVIASGTPAQLAAGITPTAPYLRELLEGHP